jgi:putative FmdB family regulatory protein
MPIYEYKCSACGHQEDHLQKLSERPLTKCPACGKKKYAKQLTAAGFQLKGSGWYASDFKGSGKKTEAEKPEAKAEAKTEAKTEAKAEAKKETKAETKAEKKTPASTTN